MKTMKVDVTAIKGKKYQLARNFIQKFRDDPRNVSITVDYRNIVSAIFIYKQSQELCEIYSSIMDLSYLQSVVFHPNRKACEGHQT
jgi:hypothetical protein